MTDAEIYLLAAERIMKGEQVCACAAIYYAMDKDNIHPWELSPSRAMAALFKPKGAYDVDKWGDGFSKEYGERQNCRVTMLLLMSEIVGGTA